MKNSKRQSRLESMDKKYVWHPFTQMRDWNQNPVVIIDKAKGNYLYDVDGHRYLDGVSSLWCNVHGHQVSEIDRAVNAQLKKVAHSTFLGLSHPAAIELSQRLVKVAPKGLTKVFYSDSGSASVEVALKMAYQYWQLEGRKSKKLFLNLKNSYHGDTLGSVSVGGIDLFHEIFKPLLFKSLSVEAPYAYRDTFASASEKQYAKHCADRVEKVLKSKHSQICALVVEPLMQGAAGMLKHPKGYLSHLRDLTRKYNVLLIVDEVATGFGRTGKMFACEHEKITPDILCLAKGITGGYLPLSATLATNEVYSAFLGEYHEFKAFFHGHTYTANPLACAAALASLDIFEDKKVIEQIQPKIKLLSRELESFNNLSAVGDIRQVGLMAGVELVSDQKSKKPYEASQRIGHRVSIAARARGVMIRPLGNVVVLMPPLSITEKEIKTLCRVVCQCIESVTAEMVIK